MANVLWTPNTKDAVDGHRVGVSNALLTKAAIGAYLVNADAVEAGSSSEIIVATAHGLRAGDMIRFTSGVLSGYEASVKQVLDVDRFKIVGMPAAPSALDTFDIMRFRTPLVDPGGGLTVVTGAATVSYVDSVVNNYGVTNVTTAAWVQLIASLPAAASRVEIFDSSGEILELGVGAAAAESRVTVIQPGGNGVISLSFNAADRISVRAITANCTTAGTYLILTFYS